MMTTKPKRAFRVCKGTYEDKMFYFDTLVEALAFFYYIIKDIPNPKTDYYVMYWDDSEPEGEKWVCFDYDSYKF